MLNYKFKNCDIIGFSGNHWHSDSINLLTYGIPRWSLSHVGIISNDVKLHEAISTVGVVAGDAKEVIDAYDGRVWIYPLFRNLFPHESRRLHDCLLRAKATPYDVIGAIRAGGLLFASLESLLWRQDFSSYFCSELVASKISEIGIYPITNASQWNPNRLMRKLQARGIVRKPIRLK